MRVVFQDCRWGDHSWVLRVLLLPVVLGVLLGGPVLASAANFFLSQSGGGAGTSCASPSAISFFNTAGNWANPKQVGKIGPGDTVFLCGTITSSLTLQNSGSSGSPVTVDGTSATMGAAIGVHTNETSWWVLQHLHWADQPTTPPFEIVGGGNGIVDDAFADNLDDFALMYFQGNVQRPDTMTLKNSFFRTRAFNYGQTEHDLVRSEGALNVTIEGNYLEMRAQGQGGSAHDDVIQCYETGSTGTHGPNVNWTIRYNRLVMNSASSPNDRSWLMMERLTGTNYVYGNVFVGLQGGEDANGAVFESIAGSTYNIYNNTFVAKSGSNNTVGAGVGTGTMNITNNIVYTASGQTALATGPGTFNRSFNHWFGTNIPSCAGIPGEVCGTDPSFTDYANNDFTLQSGSIDKGAGTNAGAPYTTGIVPGTTWPAPALVSRSVPWDRGAYVSSTSGVAPTILRIIR
jgi:hypothetical protein